MTSPAFWAHLPTRLCLGLPWMMSLAAPGLSWAATQCTTLAGVAPLAAPASGQVVHADAAPYPAQQCTTVQPLADGTSAVALQTTDSLRYNAANNLMCGNIAFGLQGGPIQRSSQASGALFSGFSSGQPSGQWSGQTTLSVDGLMLSFGGDTYRIDAAPVTLPSRTTLAADGRRETVVYVPRTGLPIRINGQAGTASADIWQCLASPATANTEPDRIRYEAEAPTGSSDLSCSPFATQRMAGLGELTNNTWNSSAASRWQQCLVSYGSGTSTQYGWRWAWPGVKAPGSVIYAYPELVIGAKPWSNGPGNDARFPRQVALTQHLNLSYKVDTQSTGPYNTSASIWLIGTPTVPAIANPAIVRTEIMIWTESVGELTPGGTLRTEVTLAGRVWEVWVAERWGDTQNPAGVVWTYVAYRAKVPTNDVSLDAREFIADAVARGLASNNDYIADVELGTEVAGGTGSLRLQRFSLDIR